MVFGGVGAGGGQQVACDGGVDADVGCLSLDVLGQPLPTSGKAQGCPGVDEAEEGDGGQYLLVAQERLVFEGSAGDGGQYINRYGENVQFAQGEGQFDALLQGFAHADDASAAYLQSCLAGGTKGSDFFCLGVRGAEGGEVGWCSLQVAVIARHARFF